MTDSRSPSTPGSTTRGRRFGWLGLAAAVGAVVLLATVDLPGAPSGAVAGPDTPAFGPQGRHACRPSCKGRICGSDGCGGSCGSCKKSKECFKGRCVTGRGKEICRLLAGRWRGTLYTSPTHYFNGRVYLVGNSCRARFTITYTLRMGRGRVVQDMRLSYVGKRLRWRGIRIVSASSNTNYYLDDFIGTLSGTRTRFTGRNKDSRGSRSRVYLYKR